MNVPTFESNILNWNNFSQQFNLAIQSKPQLDDSEKLAYLRDALKDGPVRHAIESLIQDAECYKQAIDCLQKHYDQPRMIHQAHTRAILDAPSLKDSNSKEFRCLHNIANQSLHALKVMKYETFSSFVASILELKLDQGVMFEWQRHSEFSDSQVSFLVVQEVVTHWSQQHKTSALQVGGRPLSGESGIVSVRGMWTSQGILWWCKVLQSPLIAPVKIASPWPRVTMEKYKQNTLTCVYSQK